MSGDFDVKVKKRGNKYVAVVDAEEEIAEVAIAAEIDL